MQIKLNQAQKRHIFVLLFAIPFLLGMGIDLYVPSLPAITDYFHVSQHAVQFTIGFYMLGYALGQFFLGVLSDGLGRRGIFVLGTLVYMIVSFMAAFAPNVHFLIVCRFLQGIAIAGPAVVSRAIASDCFVDQELHHAVTYIVISWALGPIIGPFIGGYLQHLFFWQADFYFFGIYSFLTLIYAFFFLPETLLERLPLHPVKIYQMMKMVASHPAFVIYTIVGSLIYSMLVIFNVVAPFLVQIDLHYSVLDYGRVALLLGLGYFIGNVTNRFIVHYFSPARLVIWSLFSAVAFALMMLVFGLLLPRSLWILIWPVFFIFCMCGFALPNNLSLCLSIFPEMGGTASAMYGSALAGGVFVLSALATLLGTHTQVPLALVYFGMMLLALSLFLLCQKFFK